jgi:hypothetical protein
LSLTLFKVLFDKLEVVVSDIVVIAVVYNATIILEHFSCCIVKVDYGYVVVAGLSPKSFEKPRLVSSVDARNAIANSVVDGVRRDQNLDVALNRLSPKARESCPVGADKVHLVPFRDGFSDLVPSSRRIIPQVGVGQNNKDPFHAVPS